MAWIVIGSMLLLFGWLVWKFLSDGTRVEELWKLHDSLVDALITERDNLRETVTHLQEMTVKQDVELAKLQTQIDDLNRVLDAVRDAVKAS